jgi:hypothetical protein
MRSALVDPYVVDVVRRGVVAAVETPKISKQCIVVADDGRGTLLAYDPLADEFLLAAEGASGLVDFGVSGDAVGCFLAR